MSTTRARRMFSIESVTNYFPKYSLKESGIIDIEERPPLFQCLLMGFQHVLTMFGGTVLVPLLVGFNSNTALFFSGCGTIIFYIVTGGKVPSYVGPSFAFIGVIVSATHYVYVPGSLGNEQIDVAAGGILVCGLAYGAIGVIVMFFGHNWIEMIMPPVVTGTVVIVIGINLSASAFNNATQTSLDAWMAFTTVITISLVNVYARGIFQRTTILIGMVVGYCINFVAAWIGYGSVIDYTAVKESVWFGVPNYTSPKFEAQAISIILPVCIVLLAENLGHLKAVGATVEKRLDKYLARTIFGDSLATIFSAAGGGPGTTTYAENIGVMAVTKNFSSLVFLVAGVIAILLSFIQKIGAFIQTIPQGVFGGLSIVVFGLVAVSGARIWVENEVDFKDSRNMLVAAVPTIIGAAMHTNLQWGNFQLDGIGLSTYTVIILYQILRGWDGITNILQNKKKTVVSSDAIPPAAVSAV